MSYSFTIRGATKAEAKRMVADELAKLRDVQPIHELDCAQAQDTAEAFIDLLPDDDDKDVHVAVYGSVSWTGSPELPHLTAAGVSASAWLVPKTAANS